MKNKKIFFKNLIVFVIIATIGITGTYAIYKQTIAGKAQSKMATIHISLSSTDNSTINLTSTQTEGSYYFSVNNFESIDSVSQINEVVCNYYIKIEGLNADDVTR